MALSRLVERLRNEEIRWSGTYVGLYPFVQGRQAQEVLEQGERAVPYLVEALDDRGRFAVAHVLLTLLVAEQFSGGAATWNGLSVTLHSSGHTEYDPGEIAALKAKWAKEIAQRSTVTTGPRPGAGAGAGDARLEDTVRVLHEHGRWVCEIRMFARTHRTIQRWPNLIVWTVPLSGRIKAKMPALGHHENLHLRPEEGFIKRIVIATPDRPLEPGEYTLQVHYDGNDAVKPVTLRADFVVPGTPGQQEPQQTR